jgi:hypothetical protein
MGITTAGYSEPLALVNRRGVGRHQRVEFAEAVAHGTTVETGGELASVEVDIVDMADVGKSWGRFRTTLLNGAALSKASAAPNKVPAFRPMPVLYRPVRPA